MRREPVYAAAIKSIGYNEDKELLEIEMIDSGRVYQYYDVPLEEYTALMEAHSIDKYYNEIFLKSFTRYKEVTA